MKNIRTTIGGALGILGSSLMGTGMLSQLANMIPGDKMLSPAQLQVMWWLTVAGLIISALGKGVTALFAADAQTVTDLHAQVDANAKSSGQEPAQDTKSNP